MEFKVRLNLLREKLIKKLIRQSIIQKQENIYYYTGLKTKSPALLFINTYDEVLVISENDYSSNKGTFTGEAITYKDYSLLNKPEKLENGLARARKQLNLFKLKSLVIGFDSEKIPLSLMIDLEGFHFVDIGLIIALQRSIKDDTELQIIKKNISILDKVMEEICKSLMNDSIIRELDLLNISQQIITDKNKGPFIWEGCIGSGKRTDNSNVFPIDKEINEKEVVLVDLFPALHGYYGDITRTFVKGMPSLKQINIYSVIKGALDEGERILNPGVKASIVDRKVRNFISEKGYGKFFNHHTGHGIGINVHEPPFLLPWSEDIIIPGNIICLEPGIYLPGWGGMRIEQVYYISEEGPIPFSKFPFEL